MHRLFVVEDVFEIKARGVVAIGPLEESEKARWRLGDTVEIRRSDGAVARAAISGVPMGLPLQDKSQIHVLLRGISKADVGPGDEVWLSEDR